MMNPNSYLSLESVLFQLAQACLWPVMLLILIACFYALTSLGGFLFEGLLRWRQPTRLLHLSGHRSSSIDAVELVILKELEGLRLCSRIAPMLGLVATMIPLGPALVAVSSGQTQAMAAGLAPAFAAVIVALIAASISFAIHSVRRRWLLQEMHQLLEGEMHE